MKMENVDLCRLNGSTPSCGTANLFKNTKDPSHRPAQRIESWALQLILAFTLCVVLLLPVNSQADKLVIATGEWAPYTSDKIENYGFFSEIVKAAVEEMGYDVEFVFYPWRRCYDSVKNGLVWAAFPYSYTQNRSREVMFSDKISYSVTKFFYYGQNQAFRYETLEDLKRYKIGGVIGYFYEETFREIGLHVDYAPREISAIEKLLRQRTDLLPLNELVGWHIIKTNFADHSSDFGVLEKPFSRDDLHLIVSKSYPNTNQLLQRFNYALRTVKDRLIYDSILERYQSEQRQK